MKTKKFIVCLLICSFLAMLIACASDANAPVNKDETQESVDDAVNDNEGEANSDIDDTWNDDLGEFDFGGYEFTVLTRNEDFINCKIDYEEQTGDILEDAIYERNRGIEERFNIKIKNIFPYDSNKAKNSIKAGDNAYDIIITRNPDAFTIFAQEGLISSFDNFTYINLDKPYWDKSVSADLTIANKRYFACGAFNLSAYDFVHVLIFNKQLIADYGLSNPYEMVKNGTWTVDAFAEMTKDATFDLNGDGKMNKEDSYGFLSSPKQILPNFWISTGLKSIGKDEKDIPYSAMGTERFFEVFQRIYEITWDSKAWFVTDTGSNVDTNLLNMFQSNQALFMDCTFFYLKSLRNMTSDFGILPYPKYTAEQEKYYSRMEGCELFFAPITAEQDALDRSSVILEAMASASAKSVVPVYYDLALKTKFTRDNESAEIIDNLFENRVFDLGDTAWCDKVRDPVFAEMFKKNNRDLASKLDSLEKTIDILITKTVDAFEQLD